MHIEREPRHSERDDSAKKFLQDYLVVESKDVERIHLLHANDLSGHYATQRDFLNDKRLDSVTIAIVPDDLWVKGMQPSESSAEKQTVLIRQSYFEAQQNPDAIAWLCHELAHCEHFLNSESSEAYEKAMQQIAFSDINTGYTYPNNLVEQFTFTKQFEYLKAQGKSRDEISTMLSAYYSEIDVPFFNKLLDIIYTK